MIASGRPPARIDILNEIPGNAFESAWLRRHTVTIDGVPAPFIAMIDLIEAKRANARPQDLVDLENLERESKGSGVG